MQGIRPLYIIIRKQTLYLPFIKSFCDKLSDMKYDDMHSNEHLQGIYKSIWVSWGYVS